MGKKQNFAKRGKRRREGLTLGLLGYGFCRVVERDFQVCSAICSMDFGVRAKKKNAMYMGGVVWFGCLMYVCIADGFLL
ncbi:hypothetical protein KY284_024196 [Solanum tuberosum]|nr:hypothetical protein KY284_024196 [Solanum tuberosum]